MVAGNGSGDSPGNDGSSLVRAPTRAAYSFADTDRAVIFPIRGAAGAADDQRDTGAARSAEKLGDLALDHPSPARRLGRAKVGEARVGGAGIDRDDVGLELHAARQRIRIEPVTEGAGWS